MGLIRIDLFTTLDGVAQAPGGPEEDAAGGVTFGGWQAPLMDQEVGGDVDAGRKGPTAASPHCSTASRSTRLPAAG